jgi:hypothetical protein
VPGLQGVPAHVGPRGHGHHKAEFLSHYYAGRLCPRQAYALEAHPLGDAAGLPRARPGQPAHPIPTGPPPRITLLSGIWAMVVASRLVQ